MLKLRIFRKRKKKNLFDFEGCHEYVIEYDLQDNYKLRYRQKRKLKLKKHKDIILSIWHLND